MRGLRILVSTAALFAGLSMAPASQAQISINIGIQPSCPYGYYGEAPYACAPMGYYGSGYFYNGIFVGMGPWSGWGYQHGWGQHRFVNDGGGRYHGGMSHTVYHENSGRAPAAHKGNGGNSQHHNGGDQNHGGAGQNHKGGNDKDHGNGHK